MGETNEQLLGAIKHYQDGLERYAKNKNDAKLMHCISKLYKLPIKVQHLEITGIGRTVNGLRKLGGEIGDHAKTLVAKWKEMVVEEEEKKPEESALDASKIPATREEANSGEEKSRNHGKDRQKSSHSTENHRDEKNSKHKKPKDDKRGHDVSKSKIHESKHKTSDDSSNSKSNHSKRKSSNKSDDDGSSVSKHNKLDSSRNITDSDSEENDERSHKNRHKYEKLAKSKRRVSSEDSSEEEEEIDRHKSKYKKHKYVEDSEEENSDHKSKHISLSKKETHRNSDEKRKSKVDTKLKKHDDKQKKRSSDKHEKSKKEQTKSKIDNSKEVKNVTKDMEIKPKSKQESSSAPDKKGKSKSSKGSSSSKVHQHPLNGIDSGSGASFAEALGMCIPLSSKTVYKKKNSSSPKEKEESPLHFAEDVPPLLKEPPPLEPLDVSISSLLPAITPNYRPLGLSTDALHKKILTDDEALSRVMSTKNQRTKVFSGNKCVWNKVPSLFEICIRILQDNIDALEYTGGVPYSILKPILEKATADQLYMMEHHNPYLIEDSDELWKLHCQKEFRNKSREELETWRDMYMRCLDEREAKLKALTANIKEAQDKSIPVRTTKLAYVDSFVKPPRNVARKQARNGTAFDARPAMTPTAKAASLAVAGEAGKIAVPNPGARAGDRSSSKQGGGHAAIKPKKAPLMAKTLSLFKNRFRR